MTLTEAREDFDSELATLVQMIASLGEEYRSKGVEFFPKEPDQEKQTYFLARPRVKLTPASFEISALDRPEALSDRLVQLWTSEGYPDLENVALALAALAFKLRETNVDEAREVSSFIYAMY